MATLTAINPRIVKDNGTPVEYVEHNILNGQTWNAGQFLQLDANGLLIVAASGDVDFKYLAVETQADPGNSTTKATVAVLRSDLILEMHELDGTVPETAKGTNFDLDVTSNVCTIDVDTVSTPSLQVVQAGFEYDNLNNNSADTLARCRVKVLQSVIDAAS